MGSPWWLQYLDPIIAATWSEDGAVHDVCKALSPRLREPNAIVSTVAPKLYSLLINYVVPIDCVQGADRPAHYDS